MSRPKLEVADIFRDHGAAWRSANAGHVSLDQLKVMTAIERCRTAALGGHVERCENCAHTVIAYNSCRNRHCPKCQGSAAQEWLAERAAELLPVPYFHVVFTLPAAIADIAYQNKAVIYDLLFKASSETMLTIAADPKHLGARIGILSVLHTWGSAMTHHPHVHMLFKASCQTMLTIAADPKHLGARIGILSVLHTWGSALTHHPHVHMIVPGGGFSGLVT
jgi:Transposase zinc-binding domain/Putative transposase